jgi:hypothetical protein
VTERSIIFNDAMSRAILSGAKTETRRPVKRQPVFPDAFAGAECDSMGLAVWKHTDGSTSGPVGNQPCVPGDTLWVRECWRPEHFDTSVEYRADKGVKLFDASMMRTSDYDDAVRWSKKLAGRWAPSIHMPRWAARTVLDVLEVRVERLQDMTEEDARAEGVEPHEYPYCAEGARHRMSFARLWDTVYPAMPWASNPWVWVVRFKRQGGA